MRSGFIYANVFPVFIYIFQKNHIFFLLKKKKKKTLLEREFKTLSYSQKALNWTVNGDGEGRTPDKRP